MKRIRYICTTLLILCSATIALAQNPQADSALRTAAQDGDMKAVNALLAKGANVNAKDDNGKTALLWVAPARDNPEMIRVLVGKGADVNAKGNEGETALMIAASQSNPRIMEALLTAGAAVDARNNEGGTALMAAAFRANIEEIKILLANGADLRLTDKNGRTAFEVAKAGAGNYTDETNQERFAKSEELLRIPS